MSIINAVANQALGTGSSPTFISLTTANLSFDVTSNSILSTGTNTNINLLPNGSGAVCIGNTAPALATPVCLSIARGGNAGVAEIGAFLNASSAGSQFFLKSRSLTIGSFSTVIAGDTLGNIQFRGDDGTQFTQSALIQVTTQGTISSGVVPGQIAFSTANTSGVVTVGMTLSNAQILTLANPLPATSGGTGSTGGAVLLAPSGPQTIATFGLTAGSFTSSGNFVATGTSSFNAGSSAGGYSGNGFICYSPTANKGYLQTVCNDNSAGAFGTEITNASSIAQGQVVIIPDVGAASANFIMSKAAATQTIGSALSVTGNLTPSQTNGIVGTTTNNSANAGSVGEFVTARITQASPTAITLSATPQNVTSISLTAGDWNVSGNIGFTPASSTVVSNLVGWVSSSSAVFPAFEDANLLTYPGGIYVGNGNSLGFNVPTQRISLSGTTTIYLSGSSAFSVSTNAFYGVIFARRVR